MDSASSHAPHQKHFAVRNVGSSSKDAMDTNLLFRQAKLAREISMKTEANYSRKNGNKPPESEQDMVSEDSGKSNEIIELNQRCHSPFAHPTRCRNQRSRIGNDHCSVIKGCEFGELVASAPKQQTPIGISLSVPIRDKKEKRKASTNSQDNLGFMCRGKGKEIGSSSDVQLKEEVSPVTQVQFVLQRNVSHKKLVRNGCILPSERAKSSIQSDGCLENGKASLPAGTSDEDSQRGKKLCRDLQLKAEETTLEQLVCEDSSRKAGQRRLVRNGCISPGNVVQHKNVLHAGKNGAGIMSNSFLSGSSSPQIQIDNPDLEGSFVNKSKGKSIVDDNCGNNGQKVILPKRVRSSRGKEITIIDDDSASYEGLGQTTTCNAVGEPNISSTQTGTSSKPVDSTFGSSQGIAPTDGDFMSSGHENAEADSHLRCNSLLSQESESSCRKQKLLKRKRKSGSSCSQFGESSSSAFGGPEIAYLHSPRQPFTSRSTNRKSENHNSTMGSIIEVEELCSPEVLYINSEEQGSRASDDSARARQVTSDEMLARQLQEQFYNETPTIIRGEIDADSSWSLQQEDGRQRASAILRRDRTNPGYVRNPRVSSRNSSRRANSARVLPSLQMAHFRINRQYLDLERRLDVLEALEAAYDDGHLMEFPRDALHVQRDFNENDYEMLLALDNNNNHVGASESQINSLPHSTVLTENYEETCAVCLEVPSIGDVIRHLPCLHKFHKECIDTWLRRKTSCPICKSGIT